MKIICLLLYVIAIIFCVMGFAGHSSAWTPAALCAFGSSMIIVGQRNKKK